MSPYSDFNSEPTKEIEAELVQYTRAHPHSPSAILRPRIMRRGRTWIALLGSTLEDGIAGLGETVQATLRAFDVRYQDAAKPRH